MTGAFALLSLTLAAAEPAALVEARRLVANNEPVKALATLTKAGLAEPSLEPPMRAGLVGLAAAGAGNAGLATRAFEMITKLEKLPAAARLAVDARFLGSCSGKCNVPVRSNADVLLAPLPVQARFLVALSRHDRAWSVSLARAIVQEAAFLDEKHPAHERAALLSAAATALESETKATAHLAALAWAHLPIEASLAWLVKPFSDEEMIRTGGPGAGLHHLEALADARQNYDVVHFGRRLCKGTLVTEKALCPSLPEALRCRAAFAIGKSLRQARRYEDAERTLQAVAARCPELGERARYLQARATMAIRGAGARALVTLERLVAEHRSSTLADDALVLAGETAWRNKDLDTAARYWERAERDFPDGDLTPQASWWLAFTAFEAGKIGDARKRLEAHARRFETKNAGEWRRATYWAARLSADPSALIGGFETVCRREPLSYEASLARGWLVEQGTGAPPVPAIPAPTPSPQPPDADPATIAGLTLEDLGLDEDAAAYFRHALARDGAPDIFLSRHLLAVGDAPSASRHLRRAYATRLHGVPTTQTAELWHLAYPLAHREAIEAAATASGVPAALLFALAREESAFDHRVVSLSGAVGLFQLMPATAITEAMQIKLSVESEDSLKEPSLNARLGAAYLGRLLRQFNRNPALALAAYNAGPGSVHKWLKQDPAARLDLFVERMPISETRDYVRRVLDSYSVYVVLHGLSTAPRLPTGAADAMADL